MTTINGVRLSRMFPYFTQGKVIRGFGRGSKDLGIPTANFSDDVVESLPAEFQCGIYYGWANLDDGPIYKMVMSVGWNPFYHNERKSMETHVIHSFQKDFYDSFMKVCICGYLRPEKNFSSVDELVTAIKADIAKAEDILQTPEMLEYRSDTFFKPSPHL